MYVVLYMRIVSLSLSLTMYDIPHAIAVYLLYLPDTGDPYLQYVTFIFEIPIVTQVTRSPVELSIYTTYLPSDLCHSSTLTTTTSHGPACLMRHHP